MFNTSHKFFFYDNWIQDTIAILATFYIITTVYPRYLQEEWKIKKGSQQSFGKEAMKGWSPLVPQQDNFTDCGIYVLQYVESFLKVFSLMSICFFLDVSVNMFLFFSLFKNTVLTHFLGPTTNFP